MPLDPALQARFNAWKANVMGAGGATPGALPAVGTMSFPGPTGNGMGANLFQMPQIPPWMQGYQASSPLVPGGVYSWDSDGKPVTITGGRIPAYIREQLDKMTSGQNVLDVDYKMPSQNVLDVDYKSPFAGLPNKITVPGLASSASGGVPGQGSGLLTGGGGGGGQVTALNPSPFASIGTPAFVPPTFINTLADLKPLSAQERVAAALGTLNYQPGSGMPNNAIIANPTVLATLMTDTSYKPHVNDPTGGRVTVTPDTPLQYGTASNPLSSTDQLMQRMGIKDPVQEAQYWISKGGVGNPEAMMADALASYAAGQGVGRGGQTLPAPAPPLMGIPNPNAPARRGATSEGRTGTVTLNPPSLEVAGMYQSPGTPMFQW